MSELDDFILSCHLILKDVQSKEIQTAKEYLYKRKLNLDSIKLHNIGYCPYQNVIPDAIKAYGKTDNPNNIDYSGFIQGRIIVPVYSEFGEAVGFATRKPSFKPGNTWWNLPLPFKKSYHMYLLNKTRKNIFTKNKIYLVEGYMDALILCQYGLNQVCSIMGTLLSPRRIGLMIRYCDSVCICMDADKNKAGQNAQKEAIKVLKRFEQFKNISIIDLPVGIDPDEYVINNGIDKLLSLEKAV